MVQAEPFEQQFPSLEVKLCLLLAYEEFEYNVHITLESI
jgi:hypothetical protein